MGGPTSTSTSPSVKNERIGRISDKRKISGSWKTKTQLATASAAATIPAVSLSACEMCVVIHQEQKKWWENVIFTIRVLSRLTALLTWAASLGWTSAVTCCNTYREYYVSVVFSQFFCFYIIGRTLILLATWLKLSFIWIVTIPNSRIIWMTSFAQFCLILFNM